MWARRAGSGNSADGGALVTLRGGAPGWRWPSRRQHHQHVPPELKPDQTGHCGFDGIGYIGSVCDVSDGLCTSGR